jgi:hypothetical protein
VAVQARPKERRSASNLARRQERVGPGGREEDSALDAQIPVGSPPALHEQNTEVTPLGVSLELTLIPYAK